VQIERHHILLQILKEQRYPKTTKQLWDLVNKNRNVSKQISERSVQRDLALLYSLYQQEIVQTTEGRTNYWSWEPNAKTLASEDSNEEALSDHAVRPKTIFFSYGHDDNKELVTLFKRDLEKRGHQVWFDEKDIGNWDDWKGKITRGIDTSQMAIAFMSKHSIRDPGVCLNEIAIAMNRFGSVYPVLLETGIEKDIPITLQHLQWPDLSKWKDIKIGKITGIDWDRWYEEKLLNLIEKIESDATRFADETRVLRETLRPSSFESKIAQHVPGFIGRAWIFDAYSHWVDHQPESRLFWIKAGPGVGKSAIAANLTHSKRSSVAASWFCDAKSSVFKNPNNAIKSIAFQLALRWEDYRVKLLRELQLNANTTDEYCFEIRKELEKKNTQDLFHALLAEPMAGLIWREHKLVVVVDALDEATEEQGNNLITELISKELSSLPEWIGFVVTSRPEAEVVNRLTGFKPFEIDTQDPCNLADLRTWYKEYIGTRAELQQLSSLEQQRIEDMLIERSGGMILFLKIVEEGFQEGSLTVDDLQGLGYGLPGLNRRYFDSFKHRFGSDYENSVKPLLRLLLAAGGPLPEDLACEVLGWNSEQFLACRNRLGSYMVETSTGYELFHKTLSEWLSNKSSGQFHLDRWLGRQLLADVLFDELKNNEDQDVHWREPIISEWLPAWLAKISQYENPFFLIRLCKTLEYCVTELDLEPLYRRALEIREKTLGPNHPDTANALWSLAEYLHGDVNIVEAEQLYRRALAIQEESLGEEHLDTANTLNGLARLLFNNGTYVEAEQLYRRTFAIREKIFGRDDPNIGGKLYSFARLLHKIGNYAESEKFYRRAVTILQAKHGNNSGIIGIVLRKLADLLIEKGDVEAMMEVRRQQIQILEQLHGVDHYRTINCMQNFAVELRNAGRYVEAESLQREAERIINHAN